jgi:hypothetical protein
MNIFYAQYSAQFIKLDKFYSNWEISLNRIIFGDFSIFIKKVECLRIGNSSKEPLDDGGNFSIFSGLIFKKINSK